MIKEIKKVTNKNVDYLNLKDNHISIQLSLDGFSFCIYNKVTNETGAFAVYEFINNNEISPYKHMELVEDLFQKDELLQLKYQSVSLTHFNNLVTQVPKPMFQEDSMASYLQYSIKVLENDFIAYDEITNTEIINVYIPFVNINNFLIDQYGSFTYKHASTVLIENLLSEYKNSQFPVCIVNVSNKNYEIVIIKNHKLEFYNFFKYNTKEDFIYYILFTAEQLNLNPEEFELVFIGDIEKDSDLYNITFQYIRNVNFYSPTNFSENLKTISKHSNYTLLNQI